MKKRVGIWVLLAAALAASGCKEEDPPVVIPPAEDQCLAPGDMALVLAFENPDGGIDGGIPANSPFEAPLLYALECGGRPECLQPLLLGDAGAGYTCVDDCFGESAAAGLSDDCRYCYIVNGLFCAGAFCLNPCLGDDFATCDACFEEQCRAALDVCVGF